MKKLYLIFLLIAFACGVQAQSFDIAQKYQNLKDLPYAVMNDSLKLILEKSEIFYHYKHSDATGNADLRQEFVNFEKYARKKSNVFLADLIHFRLISIDRYAFHLPHSQIINEYENLARQAKKHNLPELVIDCYSEIAYILFNNQNDYDECFRYCNIVMELLENMPGNNFPSKAMAYFNIGTFYYCSQEYRLSQPYFRKAIACKRTDGDYYPIIHSYNTLGLTFLHLNELDSAEYCFRQIITDNYFRSRKEFESWLSIATANIGNVYMAKGEYEKAVPLLENATINVPLEGVGVDTAFAKSAACDLVICFSKTGKTDKARFYINKWLERKYLTDNLLGSYYEAMSVYFSAEGKAENALLYKDSLIKFQQAKHEKINVARLLYAKEQKNALQIQLNKEKIGTQKLIILIFLGGTVLLLIIIVLIVFNRQKIHRKNKILVAQIKELDRQIYAAETIQLVAAQPNEQSDNSIFPRLRSCLLENRNYTKEIDADMLARKLSTNRSYIFDAVKAATGKTLQEYINSIRLDETRRLLESTTDTIDAIALDCGFASTRTFYRLFRENYDISPAQYRKVVNNN